MFQHTRVDLVEIESEQTRPYHIFILVEGRPH